MKHLNHLSPGLIATLLCLVSPLAHPDFAEGLLAYTRFYQYQRAYREFLAEAQHGHREAQFYLGEICEGGVGRSIDYDEAFRWYLASSRQGYGPAQVRLARLYYLGKGVARSLKKAFEWQKKAAEQGQIVAQYRLGRYYAQGTGTQQNPVLAYMWWTIAASGGDPDAMRDRERLAPALSAAQVEQARVLARQREKELYARTGFRQKKPSKKLLR